MRPVTVITADIVQSRTEFWSPEEIMAKIAPISKLSGFLADFAVSRGDELQAVMHGWLEDPSVVRHLRYHVRPLGLRVGVGLGLLPDQTLLKDPWAMNGEPFFRARQALDKAKKSKRQTTIVVSDNAAIDELVNCIWALVDVAVERWSQKQWDAVHAYEKLGSYHEAARVLAVRFQNVQKRCKAARWDEVRNAEQVLARAYLHSPSSGLDRSLHPSEGGHRK